MSTSRMSNSRFLYGRPSHVVPPSVKRLCEQITAHGCRRCKGEETRIGDIVSIFPQSRTRLECGAQLVDSRLELVAFHVEPSLEVGHVLRGLRLDRRDLSTQRIAPSLDRLHSGFEIGALLGSCGLLLGVRGVDRVSLLVSCCASRPPQRSSTSCGRSRCKAEARGLPTTSNRCSRSACGSSHSDWRANVSQTTSGTLRLSGFE